MHDGSQMSFEHSKKRYERFFEEHDYTQGQIASLKSFIERVRATGDQIPYGAGNRYILKADYIELALNYHLGLPMACRPTLARMELAVQRRAGEYQRNVKKCESVYAHCVSLRDFIAAYYEAFPCDDVDVQKMKQLAEIHDIAEDIWTDFSPADKKKYNVTAELKQLLEAMAITLLFESPDLQNQKNLLEEYENKTSEEAKIVSDFDKIHFLLRVYDLDRKGLSADGHLSDEIKKSVDEDIVLQTSEGKKLKAQVFDEKTHDDMMALYDKSLPAGKKAAAQAQVR